MLVDSSNGERTKRKTFYLFADALLVLTFHSLFILESA